VLELCACGERAAQAAPHRRPHRRRRLSEGLAHLAGLCEIRRVARAELIRNLRGAFDRAGGLFAPEERRPLQVHALAAVRVLSVLPGLPPEERFHPGAGHPPEGVWQLAERRPSGAHARAHGGAHTEPGKSPALR